jgi:hypothetical protein
MLLKAPPNTVSAATSSGALFEPDVDSGCAYVDGGDTADIAELIALGWAPADEADSETWNAAHPVVAGAPPPADPTPPAEDPAE